MVEYHCRKDDRYSPGWHHPNRNSPDGSGKLQEHSANGEFRHAFVVCAERFDGLYVAVSGVRHYGLDKCGGSCDCGDQCHDQWSCGEHEI